VKNKLKNKGGPALVWRQISIPELVGYFPKSCYHFLGNFARISGSSSTSLESATSTTGAPLVEALILAKLFRLSLNKIQFRRLSSLKQATGYLYGNDDETPITLSD
jgi:hypothetical protein